MFHTYMKMNLRKNQNDGVIAKKSGLIQWRNKNIHECEIEQQNIKQQNIKLIRMSVLLKSLTDCTKREMKIKEFPKSPP